MKSTLVKSTVVKPSVVKPTVKPNSLNGWRYLPILLLLLLPACSLLKTAYNNAPTATYYWLDSYLDFTSAQKPGVKAELAALHDWHRKNELPLYVEFIDGLQAEAAHDVEPVAVCKAFDEIRLRGRVFSEHLLPLVTKATASLDDKQLAYLQKQFSKKNKKWREEWMDDTPEALQEHRVDEAVKRAEDYYGNLQQPQIAVIKASIQASSFDPQIMYREILRRQADTLKTLKALQAYPPQDAASQNQVKLELTGLIARHVDSPDSSYVQHLDIVTRESCQTMAKLHNATTPEQRAHAAQKLGDYAAMFRQLSASPG